MANPYGVVGLTYDGIDLQTSDLQWHFEIERGLDEQPTVRGRDSIVPGADGRTERNRKNDTLPIVLRGFVTCDSTMPTAADRRESFRSNMLTIRSLFQSKRPRATLIAALEDGSEQSIEARPMNTIPGITTSEARFLSVELEGYDDWAPAGS